MVEDYKVKITYRNRSLENVSQRVIPLTDYCKEQKQMLMRIIADVENAFYALQNYKSKSEWPEEAINAFQKIRHKILDSANNVERMPQNIFYKDTNITAVDGSRYLADIINAASQEQQ